jgi:hypothetical protein
MQRAISIPRAHLLVPTNRYKYDTEPSSSINSLNRSSTPTNSPHNRLRTAILVPHQMEKTLTDRETGRAPMRMHI